MNKESSAGVIAPPPSIYLTGLAIGFALERRLPDVRPAPGPARLAGAAMIAAGAGLAGSFMQSFRSARTPVEPWKPTTAIVTGGPYRFTRNPAYFGMALISAGVAVAARRPLALVTLPAVVAVVDRGVIVREERYLEREFGKEYLAYKARVRRWL